MVGDTGLMTRPMGVEVSDAEWEELCRTGYLSKIPKEMLHQSELGEGGKKRKRGGSGQRARAASLKRSASAEGSSRCLPSLSLLHSLPQAMCRG